MESALYIKQITETMLIENEFPFSTQRLLSIICSHCNDFLSKTANAVHGTSEMILVSLVTESIDDHARSKFISAVKLFKEGINEATQQLVKLYPFKDEEETEIFAAINKSTPSS